MSTPTAMTDPTERLEQLAVLGMGMAQRLHDAALATQDLDHLARIGMAFHHVSRGVRQCLALEARFAAGWTPRDAQTRPVATPPQPAPERPARERTEPTGWSEHERLDCDELLDELDHLAETPEDEPVDLKRLEKALEAGVARFQRGVMALQAKPRPRLAIVPKPASRASLMTGAALRMVDSS